MVTVELFQDRAGKWRYRVKARNGEIVAASEGYTRKASAKRAAKKLYPAATLRVS